jgi:hypothetical protein
LATYQTLYQVIFLSLSHFHLQMSFPFRGRWPWGSLDHGTRTKTFKSAKDWSSSWPPAIQNSHSGEARASDQDRSSLLSSESSVEPEEMAWRTLSIDRGMVLMDKGMSIWDSQKEASSAMRAGACAEWSPRMALQRAAEAAMSKTVTVRQASYKGS